MIGFIKEIWNASIFIRTGVFRKSSCSCNIFLTLLPKVMTSCIMHQHAGVGNIIGMELSNFEVVGGLRRGKLFAGNAFYFAECSVGEENLVAAL